MKHEEAEANMAAERYLLGEMHDSELEQFEEHFFSCPACAQDVRDLSAITAGLALTEGAALKEGAALTKSPGELLQQPRKTEPPKQRTAAPATAWRWPWLRLGPSLAWGGALAVVMLFAGYQTAQLRVAMRPQALAAIVLTPATRGEPPIISMDNDGPFLRPFAVDLPGFTGKLQWDIRQTGAEKVIFHDTADAPQRDQLFQVRLPKLAPGDYTLTVSSDTVPSPNPKLFKFKLISSGR